MAGCTQQATIDRWFDGESVDEPAVQTHLADCSACRAYADQLKRIRAGFAAANADRPAITEAQMPAFLRELETRVHAKPRRRIAFITMASAAAAAIVVAVSVLSLIPTSGPKAIEATEIEETTTEIDGATTESTVSDDGTATIWVNLPEGDLW